MWAIICHFFRFEMMCRPSKTQFFMAPFQIFQVKKYNRMYIFIFHVIYISRFREFLIIFELISWTRVMMNVVGSGIFMVIFRFHKNWIDIYYNFYFTVSIFIRFPHNSFLIHSMKWISDNYFSIWRSCICTSNLFLIYRIQSQILIVTSNQAPILDIIFWPLGVFFSVQSSSIWRKSINMEKFYIYFQSVFDTQGTIHTQLLIVIKPKTKLGYPFQTLVFFPVQSSSIWRKSPVIPQQDMYLKIKQWEFSSEMKCREFSGSFSTGGS